MSNPDQDKLNTFLGKMVGDLGAAASGALVVLGDRLGLFKAMRDGGRLTASELALRTGTHERYVREWLSAQAAAGYVEYDAGSDRFSLNAEQGRPGSRAGSRSAAQRRDEAGRTTVGKCRSVVRRGSPSEPSGRR